MVKAIVKLINKTPGATNHCKQSLLLSCFLLFVLLLSLHCACHMAVNCSSTHTHFHIQFINTYSLYTGLCICMRKQYYFVYI